MTPVIGEREAIFPRDSDTDLPGHLSSVQKDPGSAADIITWLYPLIQASVSPSVKWGRILLCRTVVRIKTWESGSRNCALFL